MAGMNLPRKNWLVWMKLKRRFTQTTTDCLIVIINYNNDHRDKTVNLSYVGGDTINHTQYSYYYMVGKIILMPIIPISQVSDCKTPIFKTNFEHF